MKESTDAASIGFGHAPGFAPGCLWCTDRNSTWTRRAGYAHRLITERPDIAGLAVPGMPVGSPGMEVDGYDNQPFDVIAFDQTGEMEVFASYQE